MCSVEILYYRRGAKAGVVVDIRESKDGSPVCWGRRERPPRYGVIRIHNCRLQDLPADLREFKGTTSKVLVDESRMSADEAAHFTDQARFYHTAQPTKHTIDRLRLDALVVDNTDAWAAERLEMQQRMVSAAARAALDRIGRD